MDAEATCTNAEQRSDDSNTEEREFAPEKLLAPFLKTLKRRRKKKADLVDEECKELYLKAGPLQLLANLEDSFSDPLSLVTVLNETAELLRVATSSKGVNLYLTDYDKNVITLCPRYLRNNERFLVKYRMEPGTTLAAYVAHSKEYVISGDILGDTRFVDGIPGTDKTVKAALCLPVLSNSEGNCIAVIELYRDFRQPAYDTVNLQVCTALCGWVGIGVEQNNIRVRFVTETEIHRYLLSITQLYFEQLLTFDKVLSDLITFSKAAVKAENCSIYLMEEPVPLGSQDLLFAEVYEEALDGSKGLTVFKKKMKGRFPYLKPGVPGHVARTGETVIIHDAYEDFRFDEALDPPQYRTRSLLAIPIKNEKGVIGVLKLVNKTKGMKFTEEDAKILEIFSGFACLVCEYEELYKSNAREDLKLAIAKELLFVHTKPELEDLNAFKALPVLNTQQMPIGFFRFDWEGAMYIDEIPKYIVYVFLGSEILEPMFDHNNLLSFVLSVKKAYRPLPYHNFELAFAVFHFLFNVINRNKETFSVVEKVSLLIAGLCHALDHSGLTNSFLELKNDPIALLYEEKPLQEHHFQVCLLLLQANNLLSDFSPEQYSEITNEIHRMILATNMSFFFQSKKEMVSLLNEKTFNINNPAHKYLMKGFLMTCSQFAPYIRTFELAKKTVDNYCKELFAQGDMERTMGLTLLPVMDRTQSAFMPDYYLYWFTTLMVPSCEIIVSLLPNCEELMALCWSGIDKWKEQIALRDVEVWKPEGSIIKERRPKVQRSTVASTLSSNQSDQKSMKND